MISHNYSLTLETSHIHWTSTKCLFNTGFPQNIIHPKNKRINDIYTAASWVSLCPQFCLSHSVLNVLGARPHTVSSGHVTHTVIAVESRCICCKLSPVWAFLLYLNKVLELPQCVKTVPACCSPNISSLCMSVCAHLCAISYLPVRTWIGFTVLVDQRLSFHHPGWELVWTFKEGQKHTAVQEKGALDL